MLERKPQTLLPPTALAAAPTDKRERGFSPSKGATQEKNDPRTCEISTTLKVSEHNPQASPLVETHCWASPTCVLCAQMISTRF